MEGHVVFTEVIKNACQLHLMPLGFEFLNRFLGEVDEFGIEVARLGHAAFGCPIDDLRAAVGELRNGDIAGNLPFQDLRKTQLRPERVIVTGEAQRFPAIGSFVAAAEVVFVGDFRVVLEQGGFALQCL